MFLLVRTFFRIDWWPLIKALSIIHNVDSTWLTLSVDIKVFMRSFATDVFKKTDLLNTVLGINN